MLTAQYHTFEQKSTTNQHQTFSDVYQQQLYTEIALYPAENYCVTINNHDFKHFIYIKHNKCHCTFVRLKYQRKSIFVQHTLTKLVNLNTL